MQSLYLYYQAEWKGNRAHSNQELIDFILIIFTSLCSNQAEYQMEQKIHKMTWKTKIITIWKLIITSTLLLLTLGFTEFNIILLSDLLEDKDK